MKLIKNLLVILIISLIVFINFKDKNFKHIYISNDTTKKICCKTQYQHSFYSKKYTYDTETVHSKNKKKLGIYKDINNSCYPGNIWLEINCGKDKLLLKNPKNKASYSIFYKNKKLVYSKK